MSTTDRTDKDTDELTDEHTDPNATGNGSGTYASQTAQTEHHEDHTAPDEKLDPQDPQLDVVSGPKINKKTLQFVILGLGAVFLIGFMFSMQPPGSGGSGSGDQKPGSVDVDAPQFASVSPRNQDDDQNANDGGAPQQENQPPDNISQAPDTEDPVSRDTTPDYETYERTTSPGTTNGGTQQQQQTDPVQPRTTTPDTTQQTQTFTPSTTQSGSGTSLAETERQNARRRGRGSSIKAGASLPSGGPPSENRDAAQAQNGTQSQAPQNQGQSGTTAVGQALAAQAEAQGQTDYEKQNMQEQKQQWLASRKPDFSFYADDPTTGPVAPGRELKAGASIPITLITAINSDLPGKIVAQVNRPVYDSITGQNLLIPPGSRAIGEYSSSIAFGQTRALVAWERIIRPDGSSIVLGGFRGTDKTGAAGYSDNVDRHLDQLAAAVGASTTFDLGLNSLTAWLANIDTLSALAQTLEQNDTKETAQKVTEEYVTKVLNRQPTIRIRAGHQARILVTKDLIIPPY
jgi:type IV secretion system protein VirB10